MKKQKVVLVTGGTSGIGEATVRELLNRGCKVYDLSRRPEGTVEGSTHLVCDITDEAQVQKAVRQISKKEKRIDVLVNNAGFGISGAIEFTELADAKKQFDVNFFGLVNMNKAILPVFRKQKHGRIVDISSVAAPIAIPFQAYYSASKAAILSYSLALLNEVRPFGIEVVTILPGDIRTGFTDAREKSVAGDDIYKGRISRSVETMEHDERNGIDPKDAAKVVADQALRRHPKNGLHHRLLLQALCLLSPHCPVQAPCIKIVGMIYGK